MKLLILPGMASLAATIALIGIPTLCGEDIYVAQSSRGLSTGATVETAQSVEFFNDRRNWNSPEKVSGKIGPGDIVHLVGTITSRLIVNASGIEGSPITILFEPNAVMSSPAWPNDGAISIPMKGNTPQGYITISGGTNGMIENTDNGTNLGHHVNSTGIWLNEAHHVSIRGLTIQNLYLRATPGPDQHAYGVCVKALGNGIVSGATEVTVSHCLFHDAWIGYFIAYGTFWSRFDYSFCTVYNCNWGGIAGDIGKSSSMEGLRVHDNIFRDWSRWDDQTIVNLNHHNGFYGWAVSGGVLHDVALYNNRIGPHFGTRATSGLYCSGDIGRVLIYNNLFTESGPKDAPADGLIYICANMGTAGSRIGIFNNTFIGDGVGTAITLSGGLGPQRTLFEVRNNVACKLATFIAVYENLNSRLLSNNNLCYHLTPNGTSPGELAFSTSPTDSAHFSTFKEWQKLGYDANSQIADPDFEAEFQPRLTSPVLFKGENLSAFFSTDIDGKARPTSGAWDLGAFQRN